MGTDIHAIMQVKDRYSNIYRTVEVLHIARNYRLFGALSDVRNGYGIWF
jgi:hypothetical protein